jgi:uncharacterized zinc-type alcohol dehydrogenase-like protein
MASSTTARAYQADSPTSALHQSEIPRRALRDTDVSIKVLFCGICHTGLHIIKNDWGHSHYPVVPGHEVVGVVEAVGSKVTKFKLGQNVGVGCIVDACLKCERCLDHHENYCAEGFTMTYNDADKISGGFTYGGYSDRIVVEDKFVVSIPDGLDLAHAAPILCAGITTYEPLIDEKIGPNSKVGIVGVGGLGHLAVKLARALGAEVVAFTSKASKRDELLEMGANQVIVASNPEELKSIQNSLDLIIDTVAADHDISSLFGTLKFNAAYHILGAPPVPFKVPGMPLLGKRVRFIGSLVGGIQRTQEVLDLCAAKNVLPIIEIGELKDVNHLLERLEKGDVRYRFVLDIQKSFQ